MPLAGHVITREDLNKLGEDTQTDWIEDFVSTKDGKNKPFKAKIKLQNKKLSFEYEQSATPVIDTGIKCPCCRKKSGVIKEYEKMYKCECGFIIWKKISERIINKDDVLGLCTNGEIGPYEFQKKNNSGVFNCKLVVNKKEKKVDFKFK